MASFNEINKLLSELPIGEHKISTIVKDIRSISSQKHRRKLSLAKQNNISSEYFSKCFPTNLNEVYVDISYQRSLKLKKIYDHLDLTDDSGNLLGFSTELCGTVDFAIRPNKKVFVWDGFRRCIIALLKGVEQIKGEAIIHPTIWSDAQCKQKEATYFLLKNSQSEPLKQEELFKSGCAQGDKFYLGIKEVLVDCELDILGLNLGKPKLGGYVEFQKLVTKSPFSEGVTQSSNYFIIEASKMIANTWKNEEVSGFMLSGLAHYLHANEKDGENGNEYYEEKADIESNLEDFAVKRKGTQSSCTKDRLHSIPRESVAWKICRNVMSMSKINASKFIGINDEQSEMLSVTNG